MKTKLLKKIRKRFIVYKLDGNYTFLDRRKDFFSNIKFKSIYSLLCHVVPKIDFLGYTHWNVVIRNQRKRMSRNAKILCKK